jgi:hypothetical protein
MRMFFLKKICGTSFQYLYHNTHEKGYAYVKPIFSPHVTMTFFANFDLIQYINEDVVPQKVQDLYLYTQAFNRLLKLNPFLSLMSR